MKTFLMVILSALIACSDPSTIATSGVSAEPSPTATPPPTTLPAPTAIPPTATMTPIAAISFVVPTPEPAYIDEAIIRVPDHGDFAVSGVYDYETGRLTQATATIDATVVSAETPTATVTPTATRDAYTRLDFMPNCTRREMVTTGIEVCTDLAGVPVVTERIETAEIRARLVTHDCPSAHIDEAVRYVVAESDGYVNAIAANAHGLAKIEWRTWAWRLYEITRQIDDALVNPYDKDDNLRVMCFVMREDLRFHNDPFRQWRKYPSPTATRGVSAETPTVTMRPSATPSPTMTPTVTPTAVTVDSAETPSPTMTAAPCGGQDANQLPGCTDVGGVPGYPHALEDYLYATDCDHIEAIGAGLGYRCTSWAGRPIANTRITEAEIAAIVDDADFVAHVVGMMACSSRGVRGWISATTYEIGAVPVFAHYYAPSANPFDDRVNVEAAYRQWAAGDIYRWPWQCASDGNSE